MTIPTMIFLAIMIVSSLLDLFRDSSSRPLSLYGLWRACKKNNHRLSNTNKLLEELYLEDRKREFPENYPQDEPLVEETPSVLIRIDEALHEQDQLLVEIEQLKSYLGEPV